MDNTGRGPLVVPGFQRIPFWYEIPSRHRFAHGMREFRQDPTISEHEIWMLGAMNMITDLPDWHTVDFASESTQTEWRELVSAAFPGLTDRAWDWIMDELADKADDFRATGFITVFDVGSAACKSDRLIPASLVSDLVDSTRDLFARAMSSNDRVAAEVHAVDPEQYPLVFGQTLVLQDGGKTDLDELSGSQKATHAPVQLTDQPDWKRQWEYLIEKVKSGDLTRYGFWHGPERLGAEHLSSHNYQLLPCEVESMDDELRITSYINGLHPRRAQKTYRFIEEIVELAIEPWNECLVKATPLTSKYDCELNPEQRGRIPARIPTKGRAFINEFPRLALSLRDAASRQTQHSGVGSNDVSQLDNGAACRSHQAADTAGKRIAAVESQQHHRGSTDPGTSMRAALYWAENYLKLPDSVVRSTHKDLEMEDNLWTWADTPMHISALPDDWRSRVWELVTTKALMRWDLLLRFASLQPEPGIVLSYRDWRAGRYADESMANVFTEPEAPLLLPPTNLPMAAEECYQRYEYFQQTFEKRFSDQYVHGPPLKRYNVRLQRYLATPGLQIIVRMTGIDLTPDRPSYEGGEWHLAGFLNDHIVATAMVVLENENLTTSAVDLRQESEIPWGNYEGMQDDTDLGWTAEFAREYTPSMVPSDRERENLLATQRLGQIELRVGRLITFPNTLESRLSSFQLVDPGRKGGLKLLQIYLVDPNYRLCSTRNVPPQQHDWWADDIELALHETTGLPAELCAMITAHCREGSSSEKWEQHRTCLRQELELLNCARAARDLRSGARN